MIIMQTVIIASVRSVIIPLENTLNKTTAYKKNKKNLLKITALWISLHFNKKWKNPPNSNPTQNPIDHQRNKKLCTSPTFPRRNSSMTASILITQNTKSTENTKVILINNFTLSRWYTLGVLIHLPFFGVTVGIVSCFNDWWMPPIRALNFFKLQDWFVVHAKLAVTVGAGEVDGGFQGLLYR